MLYAFYGFNLLNKRNHEKSIDNLVETVKTIEKIKMEINLILGSYILTFFW